MTTHKSNVLQIQSDEESCGMSAGSFLRSNYMQLHWFDMLAQSQRFAFSM